MIDGFEGEKGAIVAGSRGYFLKVILVSNTCRNINASPEASTSGPTVDRLFTCSRLLPLLRSGAAGVPGAGSDQLRPEDPPQQELHHAVHALLHEEGGHAGSGPAQPV